jgi:hypothetical protein
VKCWICSRQARGFRQSDVRQSFGTPAAHPLDWVFCSPECASTFHAIYERWIEASKWGNRVFAPNLRAVEALALEDALRAVREAIPDLDTETAARATALAVEAWTAAMRRHHEESLEYPGNGGRIPQGAIRDPMLANGNAP